MEPFELRSPSWRCWWLWRRGFLRGVRRSSNPRRCCGKLTAEGTAW